MFALTRSGRFIRTARGCRHCKRSIPDGGFISAWWVILATLQLDESSNGSWKVLLILGCILMRYRQRLCPLLMSCRSRILSWLQPKWRHRHADVLIPWLFYFLFSYLGKRAYFCLDEHRFPKLLAWLPCVSVKYLISRSSKWERRDVWSGKRILTKKMLAAVTFPGDRPAQAHQNQRIYTALMKGYILGRDMI